MGGPRSPAVLRDWLAAHIARYLERPAEEIRPDATFAECGLDSMSTMMLCGDIEEEFGLEMQPQVAWNHRTVDALANYLAERLG